MSKDVLNNLEEFFAKVSEAVENLSTFNQDQWDADEDSRVAHNEAVRYLQENFL